MNSASSYIYDKDGNLITNIVIPDTVTEIKKYTFAYCNIPVTIPETVTKINGYAF